MAGPPGAGPGYSRAQPSVPYGSHRHGQTGRSPRWPHLSCLTAMNERLRTVISMGLFVVLAGYVGFSGIRLGLLLWQRFGAG